MESGLNKNVASTARRRHSLVMGNGDRMRLVGKRSAAFDTEQRRNSALSPNSDELNDEPRHHKQQQQPASAPVRKCIRTSTSFHYSERKSSWLLINNRLLTKRSIQLLTEIYEIAQVFPYVLSMINFGILLNK